MAGWPALRYEWIQTGGGIMNVGDLVQHKQVLGIYGIIVDWEEDYHHRVVMVVRFPTNAEMDGYYPEEELEVVS